MYLFVDLLSEIYSKISQVNNKDFITLFELFLS